MKIDGPKLSKEFVFEEKYFLENKNEIYDPEEINKSKLDELNSFSKIERNGSFQKDLKIETIKQTKKKNLLNIFKRIKKFANNIKNNTINQRFSNLTLNQKLMIGDKIFFQDKKSTNNFLITFSNQILQFSKFFKKKFEKLNFILKLNPDSKLKKNWDFFFLIICCYNYFIFSLKITFYLIKLFNNHNNDHYTTYINDENIDLLNIFVNFLDILLCFLTGYHQLGKVVENLTLIRKNYVKQFFISDILVFLSLLFCIFEDYFIETSIHFSLIYLLFFFNNKKFTNRLKDLQEFLIQRKEEYENYFSIAILYLKTFYIAHLMACLWYIVGSISSENTTWMTISKITDSNWESKYINSLYFSLVTMLSVGYGDIVPTNDLEKIVCIFIMIIGFSIFGFTLGSICNVIQIMNAKNQEFKENSKIITRLMKKNDVDFDFQIRIRKYNEYIFREESDYMKEQAIMNKFSKSIKEEFLNQIFGKIITKIPFLHKNFSQDFLKELLFLIKKVDFAPEELIIENKDQQNTNFYFLLKGEVEASIINELNNKKCFVYKLKNGNFFNSKSFITGFSENQNIKTETFCNLYYIKRDEFIELLESKFPEDYEKFCLLKDENILNYQNVIKCLCCLNSDHDFVNCPILHYIPHSSLVISRHNFSEPNNRINRLRKRLKMNSRRDNLYIIEKVNKYRDDKKDFVELFSENNQKLEENLISDNSIEIDDENYNEFDRRIIFSDNSRLTEKTGYAKINTNYFIPESIKNIEHIKHLYGIKTFYNPSNLLFDCIYDEPKSYLNYFPQFNMKPVVNHYQSFMRNSIKKLKGILSHKKKKKDQ